MQRLCQWVVSEPMLAGLRVAAAAAAAKLCLHWQESSWRATAGGSLSVQQERRLLLRLLSRLSTALTSDRRLAVLSGWHHLCGGQAARVQAGECTVTLPPLHVVVARWIRELRQRLPVEVRL